MAEWKKVIVSGSDAHLNSLLISNNQQISGSSADTFLSGSFSGSFQGFFEGVTNLPDLTAGEGIAPFIYDGASAASIAVSGAAQLSDNTITKWNDIDGKFIDSNITDNGTFVQVNIDADFQQDVIISGDLTVQGTASFQNTQNLLVADRFVLFASGSNTAGDGGIVVQQGTQNVGELFGYDSVATRWGFTSSFNADSSGFAPVAYVGAVQTGTGQTSTSPAPIYGGASFGYGTIHVDTDDSEIWIYA